MKFEAITIKDIAKALGLSTSTVSRALRDSYEISADTKKLVLDYAAKYNYHPNPIALSLKERRSRSIGVIVCEIANSFFSQAINGIESIAYNRGYNVIIAQSRESFERELMNLQFLTSRSVDGLIISLSAETTDTSYLEELHEKGLPIVFFDRVVDEMNTHKVIADNYQGAYNATRHLIENGYRRIAALANVAFLSIAKERLAGYRAALEDHQIPYRPEWVQHCHHGGMIYSEVEDAVNALLNLPEQPDAILATSDKLTTGCVRMLKEKGIKVPAQMGLVGFSNTDLTDLLDPSLSVIRQPAFEMGEKTTSLLLQQIESKRPISEFETAVLSTEMLIRDSSLPKKTESAAFI
jgi:DNA-binding LacI/PurR family transcriptional regulator